MNGPGACELEPERDPAVVHVCDMRIFILVYPTHIRDCWVIRIDEPIGIDWGITPVYRMCRICVGLLIVDPVEG